MVCDHVSPDRRGRTQRRALAYSIVFASRTALTLARAGEWSAASRQGREAARCGWMLLRSATIQPHTAEAGSVVTTRH
jgi:hypothetical protein